MSSYRGPNLSPAVTTSLVVIISAFIVFSPVHAQKRQTKRRPDILMPPSNLLAFPYWQISTFNAANLNGHGAGNNAMWCGQTAAQQPTWSSPPGYGNNWDTWMIWRECAPAQPSTTVDIKFYMNYDLEPGYDFFYVQRLLPGGGWSTITTKTGLATNEFVNETVVINQNEYTQVNCGGTEIVLRMRVTSDGAFSDEDGIYNTDGAVQIDDVEVRFDGNQMSFTDFEGGDTGGWTPITVPNEDPNPVNQAPVCVLPDSICGGVTAGVSYMFDGTGSYDLDGTIESYEWDFDDGTFGTGPMPSHVFVSPGWYNVVLTVADDRCCTTGCNVVVRVCDPMGGGVASRGGLVAQAPIHGMPRLDVAAQPAAEMWSREVYIHRYRFRHIREWPGRGEVYTLSVTKPIPSTLGPPQIYRDPYDKDYEKVQRSKRKKKCDYDTDYSCNSGVNDKCFWTIGGWYRYPLYQDEAPSGAFCDLRTYIEWYELDKDKGEILKAIGKNLLDVVKCLGELFALPDSTKNAIKIIKAVECGVTAVTATGQIISEINDIPYDRPKLAGKFITDGLTQPFITAPPLPASGIWNVHCEWDGTSTWGNIQEQKGANAKRTASVEIATYIEDTGEYNSGGAPELTLCGCGSQTPGSDCDILSFEYFQKNGGAISFRLCVANNDLHDPSVIGTREFIVPIDVDNDDMTGDPDPPFCGADYYVSLKVIGDGTDVTVERSLYCWGTDPCCPMAASWILQDHRPYNITMTDCCLSFRVNFSWIGDPTGAMAAWALCRDALGSVYETVPDDPCAERLPIMKTADMNCPRLEGMDYEDLQDGLLTAPITITFSEPMQMPTLADITLDPPVSVFLNQDATRQILRIFPTTQFSPGHLTLTLKGTIVDLAGNGIVEDLSTNNCGSPVTIDLCIPDVQFETASASGVPQTSFADNEMIYVQAADLGTPPPSVDVYLVNGDMLLDEGRLLIDESSDGPNSLPTTGAAITLSPIGPANRAGDYSVVADLNLDGVYQRTDRVTHPCHSSLTVGEPCEEFIAGLTAFWPFDEASSGASADLAGTNDALHQGSPSAVSGKIGKALAFDATDYLSVPDGDEIDLDTDDFSITGWVKPSSISGTRSILDKRSGSKGYRLALLSGVVVLTMNDGSGTATISSGVTIPAGQWSHVAVTVERDNTVGAAIYINGSVATHGNPTPAAGDLSNTAAAWIGRDHVQTAAYFAGRMDELALWDESLGPLEIQSLYQAGLNGDPCPADPTQQRDSGDVVFKPHDEFIPALTSAAEGTPLELGPTYPNPFNPSTTIEYATPHSGHVRVALYDVQGRLVTTLVDATLGPGAHRVAWRGRDAAGRQVATGVYFVRLTTPFGNRTEKLLLMK